MKADQQLLRFLGLGATGDLGPWTFYTSRTQGIVWFEKSPPREPPSPMQVHQRNKFRLAGHTWRALTPEMRARWNSTQYLAGLRITGYNLFTFWIVKGDRATIQTIESHTGLQLLPLEGSL